MNSPAGLKTMSPAMKDARNYHRYLFSHFESNLGKRVLEIGIGSGQYTQMMISRGLQIHGIDVDPAIVEDARKQFGATGNFSVCDLEDESLFRETAQRFRPDTIFCVNVLEHIREDGRALANFYAALPVGGKLLLLVPAFGFLYSEMDREAGHFRRYTKEEIAGKLTAAGFSVRKNIYINLPGALGWAVAKFWMKISNPKSSLDNPSTNGLIGFYDRWITGASRVLDPLAGSFAGLSLVVISERKA